MKRALGIVVAVLGLLAVLGAGWLVYRLDDRPDLASYDRHALPPAADASPGALRVTFLGVSTLLIDDGETAILTDGFFSRPGLLRSLLWTIAPEPDVIRRLLARAGIDRLAAVIVVHSHYDHAMDAPIVAAETGALLVGSESTANVGRGLDLPEDRIHVVTDGETLTFGAFRVTLVRARHYPHGMAMGEITEPLRPPARLTAWLEGGSYSVHVEHAGRRLLVQGSAGFVEGALAAHPAEVVFLGIGGLATQDDAYRDAYWREVVQAVGARRVVPIHWDDFTRSLDEPLVPMPRMLDDAAGSMDDLLARGRADGVDVRLLPPWTVVDPFAGLDARQAWR